MPLRWEEVGVVQLGAGRGTRFGRDKLAEPLLGRPLIRHAAKVLAALPLARRVVVTGPATPDLADLGFARVSIAGPDLPQSASLAEGVSALGDYGLRAILVALGDMPLITSAHLEALRLAFDGNRPVCSALAGAHCPPALFPLSLGSRLVAQSGDQGGRALLSEALSVPAGRDILLDVDRPGDLAEARAVLSVRSG